VGEWATRLIAGQHIRLVNRRYLERLLTNDFDRRLVDGHRQNRFSFVVAWPR
jgi:hypothetical protein